MESIVVWKDRSNKAYIQLLQDDTVLTESEMNQFTKAEIHYAGAYYDSDTYATAFDFSTEAANGKLVVRLGLLPLPVGNDVAELILYDPSNTDGLMWLQFAVQVRADAAKIV